MLSPSQGGGAARGPCPGRILGGLPLQEGAGRVRWRARSPPVLQPRPGRLHPPSAPLGSKRLRPLPGVGSFPPTLCREGQSCSWAGVLLPPVRPDPELTWCPRPAAPPARPLSGSQDVRPPPARLPAASAFTAVPRPRPGLGCACACASGSRTDYKSHQVLGLSRLQF